MCIDVCVRTDGTDGTDGTDAHGCARMRTDAHGAHGAHGCARMRTDRTDRTETARMRTDVMCSNTTQTRANPRKPAQTRVNREKKPL